VSPPKTRSVKPALFHSAAVVTASIVRAQWVARVIDALPNQFPPFSLLWPLSSHYGCCFFGFLFFFHFSVDCMWYVCKYLIVSGVVFVVPRALRVVRRRRRRWPAVNPLSGARPRVADPIAIESGTLLKKKAKKKYF